MYTAIELRKRYLIYVRALLSFALLLIGIYNFELIRTAPALTVTYLSVLIASNFILMLIPARRFKGIKLNYFIFMLDIALITAGAYIFTNLNIQLIMAVFLTVFIAALSRNAGLSILVAVVVNAVYLYITVLISPEGYALTDDNTLLNIPFIFIIALHSSYLAEKAEEENNEKINLDKMNVLLTKKTAAKSREVSVLSDFMENLFDSFREGVMILDEDGSVRIFNKAAEKFLGINKSRAKGAPINALSPLGGVKNALMDLRFKGREVSGKTVEAGLKKRSVRIDADYIRDKAQNEIGMYCLIRKAEGNG